MPTEEPGNAPGDVLLSGTMPQAEYMYGCVATSVGMLLGYYDLYGYRSGDITYCMDDLIEGTISVCSRGSDDGSIYDMSDPSVLANFIASTDYVSRFYGTSSGVELPYTFVNSDPAQGLNVSVWNCLADYLGTGQYWRSNDDLSTTHYYASLDWLDTTDQTLQVGGFDISARYVDFKYGLSLYVQGRGYELDPDKTKSFAIDSFSFADFKAEIDAGRPVLLSMRSADNSGHTVLAYGYNAATQEVIFDDTYLSDCRMTWTGSYNYADKDFSLDGATTVVFETDGLPVSSGGSTSSGTTISGAVISGSSAIDAGETFIGATVNSGGVLSVSSGGTANETTVNGGGMDIYSGGTANDTTVNSNGWMYVSGGGTANNTTVRDWGWVNVYGSGTANSTTVNSDGRLYVSSDGTANGTTVNDWGAMYVSSGGTANSATVNFLGDMYVFSGGTANSATVNFLGDMYVFSGGTANETIVDSGGMRVGNWYDGGGTANSTTLNGGWMSIENGGTANETAVNPGGSMYVYSGGTANSTTVNSNGCMAVYNEGTGNNVIVNAGGVFIDWGTVNSAIVHSGGNITFSGGCQAYDITVSAGGRVGGFTLAAERHFDSIEDGSIQFAEHVTIAGDSMIVSSGGQVNAITVSGGSMIVSSGGTADNTTVNGDMYVSSGGTANSTTVNGGELVIDGGSAAGVVINSGGSLWVGTSGTVTGVVVSSGGTLEVRGGASASDVVWTPCVGHVTVYRDGAVTFASSHSGVYYGRDDQLLSQTAVLNGAHLNDELVTVYVMSGGTAANTTLNEGELEIWSGGTAVNTTINGGHRVRVSSGGTALNTTINNDQMMVVYAGGGADSVIIASGELWVREGIANGVTVRSGGVLNIDGKGVATDVVWTPCVGKVHFDGDSVVTFRSSYSGIYYGRNNQLLSRTAVMNGGVLNDGTSMYVMSGGTASNIAVADGTMMIWSGGTANNTTVNDFVMSIYTGGTANNTVVDSYGYLGINGGTANSTTVNDESQLFVKNGGTANSTTVNDSGRMYVWSGGTANHTTVAGDNGGMEVSKGGTANDTTVNSGGSMVVYDGGTTNSTTVNSGGRLLLGDCWGDSWWEDVSTANKTTVNSGGSMGVGNGGIHRGSLQIAGGAVVSAYEGAIIDFTVAEHTAGGAGLINDLSLITGAPTYTFTVSASQAAGRYALAGGASGFAGTYSLGTGEENYGSITVNGDTLTHGVYSYTLTTAESTLFLTVGCGISWDPTGATRYVVEFSTDNFAHTLRTEVGTAALDSPLIPRGSWKWRVREAGSAEWVTSGSFAAEAPPAGARQLQSDEDGDLDLFFARSSGKWSKDFNAKHEGTLGVWAGTKELVRLEGKNRIADIFEGSTDANLLVLTDDTCGDALFLDDLYSAFPAQQRARLAQIDEIRAGAGDDIVDLTSQRFEYANSGMTVRGGLGNDTVWANSGENRLFGDAGNDRLVGAAGNDTIVGGAGNDSMHGGGGNDTFTFGANWGTDTVEQLAGGEVTLWFTSDIGTWDEGSLTYSDGTNSVTVSGVTADRVTLKFGAEAGYDALASLGAFADASSEKIFEDTTKGLLA